MSKLASRHYMQSTQWAELRAATGWQTLELPVSDQAVVHAYQKKTPLGNLLYIPGYLPPTKAELEHLTRAVRQTGAMTVKLEACEPTVATAGQWFKECGWKPARHVQYGHTVRLDLRQPLDELWMSMKARGRQEINYAKRDGVQIEEAACTPEDFEVMEALLRDTSQRKAFGIREKRGVLNFWNAFRQAGHLRLFFARYEGKVIAGGIFITDGRDTVWYKDAGSLPAYHKHFGPRLLLWEAAQAFKKDGYKVFDLGGTPGPEEYEHSSMKGIYIFKTAFTREVTTMFPAYELPLRRLRHKTWQRVEPQAVKLNRLVSTIKGKLR